MNSSALGQRSVAGSIEKSSKPTVCIGGEEFEKFKG
jgi:hypothetical protein